MERLTLFIRNGTTSLPSPVNWFSQVAHGVDATGAPLAP